LGERQTEDLEALCSIHRGGNSFSIFCYKSPVFTMLQINEAVWEQMNLLFQERICDELNFILNGYQQNMGICHDFFVSKINLGSQVPKIKLVNFTSPMNQADSLGIQLELVYAGNFALELEATVGLDFEEIGNNLDLLTGLISAVTHSIQLPVKIDVSLTALSIEIQLIFWSEILKETKIKVEDLKLTVLPQLVSNKYAWIGSKIEQQLVKRIKESLELDIPTRLVKLFSFPEKNYFGPKTLRSPFSIAKSVRSHLKNHSIKTNIF
jgi:hypothetical protein